MSNRANIQQETVTVRHTGETSKVIEVFDNYGQETLDLQSHCGLENFVDDELELLEFVLRAVEDDSGLDNIASILDSLQETQTGISIEGTWYDWKKIAPVFEKVRG